MALDHARWRATAEALELGREHYVAGRYFEAHLVWEEAWRREWGTHRRLLQGLIQVAAAYHKMAVQRHPLGMVKLLDRATELLAPIPDGFAQLQLDRLREGLTRSRDEARTWLSGGPAPAGPAPLGSSLRAGPARCRS
jgi:predicted metal-dependent hydrolase